MGVNTPPRFLLHLVTATSDRNNAMLNVIEANAFKHLTHLSLKLLQPNDTALKKYLGECLVQLKVSVSKLFTLCIYLIPAAVIRKSIVLL